MQFSRICNFVLHVRNQTIFAMKISSFVSTPHSKFQLNPARRFRDMNFQKLAFFLSSCFCFFFFSSWYESYHKVKTSYLIALKFATQKGGVRVHLGTKFG